MGKQWKQCQTLFLGAPKSLQMVTAAMKLKDACSLANLDSELKSREITLPTKVLSSQNKAMVFPVVMYRCENWTIKKAECLRIDTFELWCWWRLLTVPWTAWWSNQSIPKGNQPWIFTGRIDAEAPIVWPANADSRLTGNDPDAGKDWGQEEKGTTEDEMVGWHHRFNGHELEQTPGDSEGQGSLMCYSPWGHKELDMMKDWTTTTTT